MRTRKLIGLGLAVIVTYAIFIQSAFAEGPCDEACAEGGCPLDSNGNYVCPTTTYHTYTFAFLACYYSNLSGLFGPPPTREQALGICL